MTTPPDLPRLLPGDRVQDSFLVLEVETRRGDYPHTVLTLGNWSGAIPTAPFWAPEHAGIEGIARRTVVHATGEVALYRDKAQLKVTSIRRLPRGSVPPSRLLPSVGDVGPCWACLDGLRRDIQGSRLRAVLDLFFEDQAFRHRYQECPASIEGHHAAIGGLVKHTSEVASIGVAIAKCVQADMDLVVAAALLHDIGKLEAYSWDAGFEPTVLNALHGHVVLGALMLDRAVRACPTLPCSEAELSILLHLVLSHHGKREFGAPVPPLTLEAEVLHHADQASARTTSMAGAVRNPQNFAPGETLSSSGLWQLDRRRVYRGCSDWGA